METPELSDVSKEAVEKGLLVYNDGGRSNYFKGSTGDCVTRAIAIATGIDYKEVYDAMHEGIQDLMKNGRSKYAKKLRKKRAGSRGTTPRNGVSKRVYGKYLLARGWRWVATMGIGTGCKVHLKADELPSGTIIVRVSKHLVTVIDGVMNDTYDCSRQGSRCVYGYYVHDDDYPFKKKKVVKTVEKKKVLSGKKVKLQKFTKGHVETLLSLVDNRLETIEDDPASADSFETQDTLQYLRNKIEFSISPRFSKEEKKWLHEELSNAAEIGKIGIISADKLTTYIDEH